MGAKSKSHYPWPTIVAELRSRPGQWRLLPAMVGVPTSVIERVRRRSVRALRLSDGKIHARKGVHLVTDDGREIADVWLCFTPHPQPKDTA